MKQPWRILSEAMGQIDEHFRRPEIKAGENFGQHRHFCWQCDEHWVCPQITHCRRSEDALCLVHAAKGEKP